MISMSIKKRITLLVAIVMVMSLFLGTGVTLSYAAEDGSTYVDKLNLASGVANKKYSGNYKLYVKNIKRKYGIKKVSFDADASGEGIDRITFTYETTISYKMTNAFVKKVAKTAKSKRQVGDWYYAVLDDNTGKCIENDAAGNVIASSDGWTYSKYQKVKAGKYYCTIAMKASSVVELYVPHDRIGEISMIIGLSTIKQNTSADKSFWNGKKAFKSTSMYKKYSNYAKRIKLTDLM